MEPGQYIGDVARRQELGRIEERNDQPSDTNSVDLAALEAGENAALNIDQPGETASPSGADNRRTGWMSGFAGRIRPLPRTPHSVPHEASDIANLGPAASQLGPENRRTKRILGVTGKTRPLPHTPPRVHLNLNDYKQKYPDDEIGEEMGPNARVWRVYLDEAQAFDIDMIEGWKDTLDVLLVFAGLFSAVVSTLVTQTSQALQLNFEQVTASLLTELVSLERAVALGQSVDTVPASPLNTMSSTTTTNTDRWVNGLWFTSLSFSLATALVSVLVKQWLQNYVSTVSGVAREQVHIRQFRFHGLQKWHVRGILGMLPVLMHISLRVFFAGLVVFLHPLDTMISGVMTVVAILAYAVYFITNMLPLQYADCPYRTPLTYYMNMLFERGSEFLLYMLERTLAGLSWLFLISVKKEILKRELLPVEKYKNEYFVSTLSGQELELTKDFEWELDIKSLLWLSDVSSNPIIINSTIQALSAIKGQHMPNLLMASQLLPYLTQQLHSYFKFYLKSDNIQMINICEKLARGSIKLKLYSNFPELLSSNDYHLLKRTGEEKNMLHIVATGYCGSMLSKKPNSSQAIHRRIQLSDLTEFLKRHSQIPTSHFSLFLECVGNKLCDSEWNSKHNWIVTSYLCSISVIKFTEEISDDQIPILENATWCLCLMTQYYISKLEISRPYQTAYSRVIENYLKNKELLKKSQNKSGAVQYDYGNQVRDNINYLKLVFLAVVIHILEFSYDWPSNQEIATQFFEQFYEMLKNDSFLVFQDAKLQDMLLLNVYSSLAKLLKSDHFVSQRLTEKEQITTMMSYNIFKSNQYLKKITSGSLVETLLVSNVQFMRNLLQILAYDTSKTVDLVNETLGHLQKCLNANTANYSAFVAQNGIDALKKAQAPVDMSPLDPRVVIYESMFDSQCLGNIVLQLFSHVLLMNQSMENELSNLTKNNLQAECLQYTLKSDHLVWCCEVLIKAWKPTLSTFYLQNIHLLDMYKLSQDKPTQWLEILKMLVAKAEEPYIRLSKGDVDILEQLKKSLGVDPTDPEFFIPSSDHKRYPLRGPRLQLV